MGLTPRPDRVTFRDRHAGQVVWVIASGASLDYVDPRMLAGQVVVAVNYIGEELALADYYCATHYHYDANILSDRYPNLTIVVPEDDQGGSLLADHTPDAPNVWSFPTNPQMYGAFTVEAHWPTDPDALVVGPTGLHFAMHFAAYLVGAGGTIILVGADCGLLDGHPHRAGHSPGIGAPWGVWADTLPRVADRLRADGTSVHSLNPFVNFALEGHQYVAPGCTIN